MRARSELGTGLWKCWKSRLVFDQHEERRGTHIKHTLSVLTKGYVEPVSESDKARVTEGIDVPDEYTGKNLAVKIFLNSLLARKLECGYLIESLSRKKVHYRGFD